jgi:hypothetical protein
MRRREGLLYGAEEALQRWAGETSKWGNMYHICTEACAKTSCSKIPDNSVSEYVSLSH